MNLSEFNLGWRLHSVPEHYTKLTSEIFLMVWDLYR